MVAQELDMANSGAAVATPHTRHTFPTLFHTWLMVPQELEMADSGGSATEPLPMSPPQEETWGVAARRLASAQVVGGDCTQSSLYTVCK